MFQKKIWSSEIKWVDFQTSTASAQNALFFTLFFQQPISKVEPSWSEILGKGLITPRRSRCCYIRIVSDKIFLFFLVQNINTKSLGKNLEKPPHNPVRQIIFQRSRSLKKNLTSWTYPRELMTNLKPGGNHPPPLSSFRTTYRHKAWSSSSIQDWTKCKNHRTVCGRGKFIGQSEPIQKSTFHRVIALQR